ncbi:hypothetical protein BC940DRAFT_240290 [Gongronella butleri]|nr:hypothetical protein BC940DRAFT_240290 [Gongronella butleri]
MQNGAVFINNHVTLTVVYSRQERDPSKIQLVGFEVYPESLLNSECQRKSMDALMQQVTERRTNVKFTYSVKWKEVQPHDRPWSMFVMAPNPDTYLASSINMSIMLLLLSLVVLVIIFKTTRKEASNFDDVSKSLHDDLDDVVGWRLVHRDVFRRPIYGGLLAPLLGSGVQLMVMLGYLIVSIANDWVHLANPASIIHLLTKTYIFTSVLAGYWSARVYKMFRGRSWLFNAALTGFLVPGVIMTCLFAQTVLAWSANSSLAISFRGWMKLISFWLTAVVPLTFLGSWVGERQDRIENPVRTTQMPRLIPKKRWYQEYHIR